MVQNRELIGNNRMDPMSSWPAAGPSSWHPRKGHRHVRTSRRLHHLARRLRIGGGLARFWGLEGPEYLAWLGEQPEVTYLMGANTYRLMSGFAAGEVPEGPTSSAPTKRRPSTSSQASKVVFSSSLEDPLRGPTPRSSATTPSRRSAR